MKTKIEAVIVHLDGSEHPIEFWIEADSAREAEQKARAMFAVLEGWVAARITARVPLWKRVW